MAEKDHVAELYEAERKLSSAKENGIKENQLYIFLIEAVKGNDQVKQLAAQFIPRFFDQYQELQERAVDAQLDLCEDEELRIRIYAIRGLAELCKRCPGFVTRIADVLGQLLLAEDAIELQTVKRTFLGLFDLDMWSTFGALFQQIKEGDDELRQKGIEYLGAQVLNLWNKIQPKKDLQKYLIEGIKECIDDQNEMTTREFKICLRLLSQLLESHDSKILASEIGKLAIKKATLDNAFDVQDEEHISRFLSCFSLTNSLTNHDIDSTPFMIYFVERICVVFSEIPEKKILPMLNAVVDCSKHIPTSTATDSIQPIYSLMEKYMPKKKNIPTKINISIVSCLLSIFQQLEAKDENIARHIWSKVPTSQVPKNKIDKRKDFKERLSFLQANVKDYMSEIRVNSQTTRSMLNKISDKEKIIMLNEKRKSAQMDFKKASDLQITINNFLRRKKDTTALPKKKRQLTPKGMIRNHLEKMGPVGIRKRSTTNNIGSRIRPLKRRQLTRKSQGSNRRSKNKPSMPRQMQTFYVPPKNREKEKNEEIELDATPLQNSDRFRARTGMRSFKGRGPCKYRPGRGGGRSWIFSN